MAAPGRERPAKRYLEPAAAITVLLLAVILLYGHTLQVPLYLDSQELLNNYRLRDLAAAARHLGSPRGLTELSFALNYRLTGWALAPLHLTNIALHFACAILVWLLLRRLLASRWLPLLGATLFLAHPLQTQAVTYVVQRAALLSAAFFLLAFYCHLRMRAILAAGGSRHSAPWRWSYLGAVFCGAGAVLAKENAAVLPVVLIAYDYLFPLPHSRSKLEACRDYLPFFIMPLLVGGGALLALSRPGLTGELTTPLASLAGNSPLHYLVTEFSVIWVYLRLLVLPRAQALEHDYPVVAELLTWPNLIAGAGLLLLACLAWRVRHRRPLLTFGTAWFFLTLAVESSVIPLDPLYEHRLYLPLFGVLLVGLEGLPALLGQRWTWGVLGIMLAVYAPLTWRRNALWTDPIAFYEENLRVAPFSERAIRGLASRYENAGRAAASRQLLENKIAARPQLYYLYIPLAKAYARAGNLPQALALLDRGIADRPQYTGLYEVAALVCKTHGDLQRGRAYLQQGLTVPSTDKSRLLNALGLLDIDAGDLGQAEQAFQESLARTADDTLRAALYANLGTVYLFQERWLEARSALQAVLTLTPGNPLALEQLAQVALRLGDLAAAEAATAKLRSADPAAWPRAVQALTEFRRNRPGQ